MGGMQVLQWGVSHPEFMDSLIALTPMARTAPWAIAVNEATRKALMADAAFNDGNYEKQPEKGWCARANVLQVLATRTPEALKAMFPNPLDILPWIKAQEDAVLRTGFDANHWIAQTWAYDPSSLAANSISTIRSRRHPGRTWPLVSGFIGGFTTTQGKRGLGTGGGDSRFALLHVCSASHILVNQCHDGPLHVLTAIITNERHQKIDGILDLVLLSGMWVGQEVTVPLHVLSDATVHFCEDTHLVAPASSR